MITLKRIINPEDMAFQKLTSVYVEAFPEEERREIAQLKELMTDEPLMYFNSVECDGELSGLFVYWNFGTFYYLEHLAVFAEMRNKRIGQQVLNWVKENLNGLRLLEVEPAETEIAIRRINYYQRNEYQVLDKSYKQPSYRGDKDEFPLWIMGNEATHDQERLLQLEQVIKDKVYYRK